MIVQFLFIFDWLLSVAFYTVQVPRRYCAIWSQGNTYRIKNSAEAYTAVP